jgi:hypothetical protein
MPSEKFARLRAREANHIAPLTAVNRARNHHSMARWRLTDLVKEVAKRN